MTLPETPDPDTSAAHRAGVDQLAGRHDAEAGQTVRWRLEAEAVRAMLRDPERARRRP